MDNDVILLGIVVLGWFAVSGLIVSVVLMCRQHWTARLVREEKIANSAIMKRLQESETRLRAIVESEPECVKMQDADGIVLEINPAGLKLVDADFPEEIVGKPIYSVVAPEYIASYKKNLQRVFSGEALVYEFKSVTLKGRVCWMETHAAPLHDESGNIYALLGITRDITEHKWAIDQTRQHQLELARVARLSTMGEMATGLAHELNQPLAAIANFTRGCICRLQDGHVESADLIEALEEVCEQADRAGEIMSHIRDFVRKSEPRMVAIDINQTIHHVTKFVEAETDQHHTSVKLDLAEDLPHVKADAIMIEQVICNLMRNAIEAMEGSKTYQRKITISTAQNGANSVTVKVEDTGPGISRSVVNHIFDQFFTTKSEGVGMGLSISRSIIESHGGKLRVQPALCSDSGTLFTFSLKALS